MFVSHGISVLLVVPQRQRLGKRNLAVPGEPGHGEVRRGEQRERNPVATDQWINLDLGLSENSVPLHPMVNDHYPY